MEQLAIAPKQGDFVRLREVDGRLGECHTYVDIVLEARGDTWLIEDVHGEHFVVARYPDDDTRERNAYAQVMLS